MKVGIIGFARSGKTTVFNALTGAHAEVGAFGSREANVAVLKVPDKRVEKLAAVYRPKKVTHAEFQFVDVAPQESPSRQKVLDDAALTLLKQVSALAHVVRAFRNPDVAHPIGSIDPVRDCTALEEELRLADLLIIEKRLERLEKEHRKDAEHELLCRARDHIESGEPLRTLALAPQDAKDLSGFTFLSQKPLLILANYGEETIGTEDPSGLKAYAAQKSLSLVELCGEMELEVAQLIEEDRDTFRKEYGLGEDSRERFIQAACSLLNMITFLTANENEVRAWMVPVGTKVIDAAGVIHSDMQRGFIRAEVVSFEDFEAAGSMAKAKESGHMRLEGKEHVVQDGDIVFIRFHV